MSFINDNKFVHLSDKRAFGTPKEGTTSSASKRAIHFAFWSGVGKTIGHLVNKS